MLFVIYSLVSVGRHTFHILIFPGYLVLSFIFLSAIQVQVRKYTPTLFAVRKLIFFIINAFILLLLLL